MDLYTTSLLLGGVGLGVMAISGLGRHGGDHGGHGGHGHGGDGHIGDAHAGHMHAGDAHGGHSHVGHSHGGHAHGDAHGQAGHSHSSAHTAHVGHGARDIAWALMSPRILFSFLIGFGMTGELLRGFLGGPMLFVAGLAGGVAFERLIVAPLWNLAMRFASKPALTLESVIADEATAVSNFDANGQGLIAVELDGQMIQILGTLQQSDRAMGVRVRAGERVRIEDVDPAKNCCTVSAR